MWPPHSFPLGSISRQVGSEDRSFQFILALHELSDVHWHLRELFRPPRQLCSSKLHATVLHLLKIAQQLQTFLASHDRATSLQAATQGSTGVVMDHNVVPAPSDAIVSNNQPRQGDDRLHWVLAQHGLMVGMPVKHRWTTPIQPWSAPGRVLHLDVLVEEHEWHLHPVAQTHHTAQSGHRQQTSGLEPSDGLQQASRFSQELCHRVSSRLNRGFRWSCISSCGCLALLLWSTRLTIILPFGVLGILDIISWYLGVLRRGWFGCSLNLRHLFPIRSRSSRCWIGSYTNSRFMRAFTLNMASAPTVEAATFHFGLVMQKGAGCASFPSL